MEIIGKGIVRSLGIPKMNDLEIKLMDLALNDLFSKKEMVQNWYCKYCSSSGSLDSYQIQFFKPKALERFEDCAYGAL